MVQTPAPLFTPVRGAISVRVCTWNLHGCPVDPEDDLGLWLFPENQAADLYVIGIQAWGDFLGRNLRRFGGSVSLVFGAAACFVGGLVFQGQAKKKLGVSVGSFGESCGDLFRLLRPPQILGPQSPEMESTRPAAPWILQAIPSPLCQLLLCSKRRVSPKSGRY